MWVLVFLGGTSTKLELMYLAQGHKAGRPVRQEPTALDLEWRILPLSHCLHDHSNTDASLTADPGVVSLIPARSHTFVEIDHEIISTVILLPSTESFKKGFCQLQAKVCARSTG